MTIGHYILGKSALSFASPILTFYLARDRGVKSKLCCLTLKFLIFRQASGQGNIRISQARDPYTDRRESKFSQIYFIVESKRGNIDLLCVMFSFKVAVKILEKEKIND